MTLLSFGLGFLMMASSAVAQIGPDTTGFGPLPAATFGGSGIPNNAVAQSSLENGLTLGLTATPRSANGFTGPTVLNDGAGTFFAQAGTFPGTTNFALWNFNFYIGDTVDSNNVGDYSYRLFYDFNPAIGNPQSSHGFISIPAAVAGALNPVQNSYNLGMGFLGTTSILSGVTAPAFSPFNPNALGQYSFKLAAYTSTGTGLLTNPFGAEAFNTSMVVSVVPEPGEWAMMLAGLGVVSLIAKRRRKIAV